MSWKTALYHYVHAKNQAELEFDVEPIWSVVADGAFLKRKHAGLQRLKEQGRDRKLQPLRQETKLRLLGVKDSGDRVTADIELRRRLFYRISHHPYTEERIEQERVALDADSGKWLVRRAEAKASERLPAAPFTVNSAPSVPYINHSILNSGESFPRKIAYDRARAVQYAETWWNRANPMYLEFEVDCTNFVSQCLFAGRAPMNYTGKRESGWWYAGKQGSQEQWSYSWAVANSLQTYTASNRKGMHGFVVGQPWELQPGDMISYDWDGNGRFQHNTFVTAMDANGMPLVNAHTFNARHRYWEYLDSPAWTPMTRYVFVRIADVM